MVWIGVDFAGEESACMTPGEIEAIKAMRADPNIPEDAKPSLPEGY
ncbi:MAG: hypothetical protein K2G85_01160 [Muribaculaceae bacterium]|nr:hypothetical protein [Muribaculaceae bacterium]